MNGFSSTWRFQFIIFFAILAILGGGVLWQWGSLQKWYAIRGLKNCTSEERDGWITYTAQIGKAVVPDLLAVLETQEPEDCLNAQMTLMQMGSDWGWKSDDGTWLSNQIANRFCDLSEAGKAASLEMYTALCSQKGELSAGVIADSVAILDQSTKRLETGIRARALVLATNLISKSNCDDCLNASTKLLQTELRNSDPKIRMEAVRLSLHPYFQEQPAILQQVAGLLNDEDSAVRRGALLAVGQGKQIISDEDLLPLLHDRDTKIQQLCEATLRARGLQDSQILLGRLISDGDARARLKIILHLPKVHDVEPSIWLQRLTQDKSPSVRAAAVRMAGQYGVLELRGRIAQMAQEDPNESVRAIAQYYLPSSNRKVEQNR